MSIVGLLIGLLLFCVVIWIAQRLLTAFSIGDPIATVVYVIIVVLAIMWLLQLAGLGSHLPLRLY